MTGYTLRKGAAEKSRADAVVIGLLSDGPRPAPGGEGVAAAFGRRFAPMLATLGFRGTPGEVATVPTAGRLGSPLLVLVGMGAAADATAVRRAAGVAARAVPNAASVALALPAGDPELVRAVVEGFELGGYSFDAYRSGAPGHRPGEAVVLSDAARTKAAAAAVQTARTVAAATMLARDWVNTPPADLGPPAFAAAVAAEARRRKGRRLTVSVTDEKGLAAGGFGGILAVGQGSAQPSRLVRLSYRPKQPRGHLALVGKGITFDSGGLNLKTNAGMRTMKSDMGGAAAVAAATLAIADLGLPVAVTTFVPMAENMPSGSAVRPGDVVTTYSGKTVEILNPDAEGRMVLADALALAVETGPDLLVDMATLTGAAETALGDRVSAVLGTDEDLVARLRAAGDRVGESYWPLPIAEEMPVKVRTYSTVADLMQHNVDRWGGALYAAAFLAEFTGDLPWAHCDIAGTAFNTGGAHGHVPAGGTGVGVAALVELAASL